jgi:methylase of polypeptide subunit release factors
MPMTPKLPDAERLSALSPDLLAAFRQRLREAGYDDRMIALGESVAPGLFDALRLPIVCWTLTRADTPAHDLARLFAYDDTLDEERARRALPGSLLEALADAEVVTRVTLADGSHGWRARYRLMPFEELWVLADDPASGADTVMGPGPTTLELAHAMPDKTPPSVLDVGCGAGTFALLAAARGSSRAVGIDINPRAVTVARFNAALNGLGAAFLAGDLYAPVASERFDLVVSQPPFVIRPPDVPLTTYLHGGAMGDEFSLRLVAETPAMIAPGGRALVLMDSAVRPKAPLFTRLRQALANAPVDLLVFVAKGAPPAAQAIAYTSLEVKDFGAGYADAVLRYYRHLDAVGVNEVSHAIVVLARHPRAPRYSVTLAVKTLHTVSARAVEATLAALDLATSDDATVLAARVTTPPGATFVEERARPDRNDEPTVTVRIDRKWVGNDQSVSEATFALLGALDATKTVAEAVAEYAELCGVTPDDVRADVLAFVRQSLGRGLLIPG